MMEMMRRKTAVVIGWVVVLALGTRVQAALGPEPTEKTRGISASDLADDHTRAGLELQNRVSLVIMAAFKAKYGPDLPISGEYSGSLANNGEQITLIDAIGRIIQTLTYEDGWYDRTDVEDDVHSVTELISSQAPSASHGGWGFLCLMVHHT